MKQIVVEKCGDTCPYFRKLYDGKYGNICCKVRSSTKTTTIDSRIKTFPKFCPLQDKKVLPMTKREIINKCLSVIRHYNSLAIGAVETDDELKELSKAVDKIEKEMEDELKRIKRGE